MTPITAEPLRSPRTAAGLPPLSSPGEGRLGRPWPGSAGRARRIFGGRMMAGAAIGLLLLSGHAEAQPRPNPVTALATLQGTCERLVIAGRDATPACDGKLLNTNYRDSRSGFYFVTKDGAALTFSGLGKRQVKPHPDRAVQPIDLVIFGYGGQHDRAPAVGECDFTNPEARPSRITCRASTAGGVFEAVFLTDGRPPKVTHPR